MRKFIVTCLFLSLALLANAAAVGSWRNYLSYEGIQQIVAGGDDVYILSSHSLWSYRPSDQSIVTYDKVNGLNDVTITGIAWSSAARRLVIVYDNANIDLLETSGNIINIAAVYQRTITGDKTVNSIFTQGRYAYLACGFGIVKLDVSAAEISETYMLGLNVVKVDIQGNRIFAKSAENEVWSALLTDNLIDKGNWSVSAESDASLFRDDNSAYNKYYPTVSALNPDGPRYNYFGQMKFINDRLYTCGGGWYDGGQYFRKGTVQILKDDSWSICQDDMTLRSASRYIDVTSIAIDPQDESHIFAATCGQGLLEFRNGVCVNNFTEDNSEFQSAIPGDPEYVRVDGLVFDHEGYLWATNSESKNVLVKYKDNQWEVVDEPQLYHNNIPLSILKGSILDHHGDIWMVNNHHVHPATLRINPDDNTVTRYDTFVNDDGTSLTVNFVRCVAEDTDGNIWIGTDAGPLMLDEYQINDPSSGVTQIKVARNDGTNFADYLLSGVDITCIAIDRANRKWFGTASNGVYYISDDGQTQLAHFTTMDSEILSDNIESIAINDNTGEVFIGTDKGLCSYRSGTTNTTGEMTKDNVYAYPNPVTSDFTGYITVVGLTPYADVKITSSSGKIIAEGRSQDGTFSWNGRDKDGKRVASGVYMVMTAKKDGTKGTVCKIAVIR